MSSRAAAFIAAALLVVAASVSAARADEPFLHAPAPLTVEEAARHPVWLGLVRWVPAKLPGGDGHVDVTTETFYLSGRKDFDPAAELAATVAALKAQAGEDPEAHALCRFPARARFVKAMLGEALPEEPGCARLNAWRRNGAVSSVSVVLASGHLSNPGSFYGHLLLKLNAGEETLSSELLDTAVNYGAVFGENQNPILYVAKGVGGGYTSLFTHLEYFHHNHNYAETQLRDIWEYRLSLSPERTAFLVDHIWEMIGVGNRYYFAIQNCAYRIAEIVNVVVDEPLLPATKFWSTPVDVFRRLSTVEQDGRPLVRRIERLPSRQNRFRERYLALSPDDRALARNLAAGPPVPPQLAPAGAAAAEDEIMTALDYLAFVDVKTEKGAEERKARTNDLLLARLSLPAAENAPEVGKATPPHEGDRSTLLQLRYLYNTELGHGAELRFRPVYSDFLSQEIGVLPYSELSIFDVRLRIIEDDVSLRRLDVIRVTTLNPNRTGLPADGDIAWRLRFGAEAREVACTGCTVGYVEGGAGKALALGGAGAVYALGLARTRIGANNDSVVQAGAGAGVIGHFGKIAKISLEGGVWREIDGPETSAFARLESRLAGGDSWDIRAIGEYETGIAGKGAFEGSFGASIYW